MTKDAATNGYAKAIFEIASSEGEIQRVADELFRVARVFEKENKLRESLTDIALPTDAKEKLLDELLGEKVSPHTLNVMKFVISQGKARRLVEIADELARLAEEESKREIAEVRTAVPLDDKMIKQLEKALGNATDKNVTVKVIVDPSVIGGVVARIGDTVIDGSIQSKLQSLKEHLNV